MVNNDRGGVMRQGLLDDDARIHARFVDGTGEQNLMRQHVVLRVKEQGAEVFTFGAGNLQAHKIGYQLRADRKSTRLNSSHVAISYAVFCVTKKNNEEALSSSRQNQGRLDTARVEKKR